MPLFSLAFPKEATRCCGMTVKGQDLQQQQDVLGARARMLATLPAQEADALRPTLDESYRQHLASVSPERLAPVLVRRNHEAWFAAFLVQRVGDGGARLLVVEDDWHLTRAKKSSTLVRIPRGGSAEQAHAETVVLQARFRTKMAKMLREWKAKKCRMTARKGSTNRKSKKATARNS